MISDESNSDGTRRFRGLIASASLKRHFPVEAADRRSERIPRLDCLGLIEAGHPSPRSSPGRRSGFRGLIASASLKRLRVRIERQRQITRFRGLIASASLKLLQLRHLSGTVRGIPRLDCLGLIEARPPPPLAMHIPDRFRGLIASASLKRRLCAREEVAEPRFRGLIASASLKP